MSPSPLDTASLPAAITDLAPERYVAFQGKQRLFAGQPDRLRELARSCAQNPRAQVAQDILVFDAATGEQVELGRLAGPDAAPPAPDPRGRGRPRLGVVAREVTLLPRHWEWLASQPGGASVALRKLVETASRASRSLDRVRQSREACYRFMNAIAGDLPYFEEATRALYRGDADAFDLRTRHWPPDIREQARAFAAPSFEPAQNAECAP